MADYKRMISYMYQYENGIKRKNVGYARIEARNGKCKFTLHMQILGQPDSIIPTYLIRRDDKSTDLIYLGDSVLKNHMLDSKLFANEANINESGYGLSDIGGIILFLNGEEFFATEWDDRPIIAKEIMEAMKPKPKQETDKRKIVDREDQKEQERVGETKELNKLDHALMPKKEVSEDKREKEGSLEEVDKEFKPTDKSQDLSVAEELLIPKYKLPRGWKTVERMEVNPYAWWNQKSETSIRKLYQPVKKMLQKETDKEDTKETKKNENEGNKEEQTLVNSNINLADNKASEKAEGDPDTARETVKKIERDLDRADVSTKKIESNKGSESAKKDNSESGGTKDLAKAIANLSDKADQSLKKEKKDEAGQSLKEEKIKESGQNLKQEKKMEKAEQEKVVEEKEIENKVIDSEIGSKVASKNPNNTVSPKQEVKKQNTSMESPIAARFFEKYPRIRPFEDNEVTLCVKIEPKDIGLLPKELWGLSNNSFLLHGYYSYRHIIFGKMMDRYGSRYIIGVPGTYHNKEKFIAKMFGFDCFKPVRRRELRQGDFGYWYLAISL
ncbi:MAG: hypothetical protein GX306_09005 [Clostridiales bacterium]|nr:hypothetical protein [Clostridiales bacterium]